MITFPDATPFSLTANTTSWQSQVKESLKSLKLESLIDTAIPRPIFPSPFLLDWAFWSLAVREWLFIQLDGQTVQLIKGLPTQPIFADDLWKEIHNLQLKDPEEHANKATRDLFTMRRSDFTTVSEYIEAWQNQNDICKGLRVGITPYMATVLMLSQLEEELSEAVSILHGQLATKPGGAVNMRNCQFHHICNKLFLEASFLPLQGDSKALVKESSAPGDMEGQTTDSEHHSKLLQLPGELRNQIYICLFASTKLTFGHINGIVKRIGPATDSLAIIHTCRQINQESKALWPGHVLFNFRTPKVMLDRLSTLPLSMLSGIRHLRVDGVGLDFVSVTGYDEIYHRLVWMLKLLPGLRLDRLTVIGSPVADLAYDTLRSLIEDGTGWKELHFMTPNPDMFNLIRPGSTGGQPGYEPQPSTWNDILCKRDGANFGACITIHRSIPLDTPGAISNQDESRLSEKAPTPQQPTRLLVTEDEDFSSVNEASERLLVVVKRGKDSHIAEENGLPYQLEDIFQWTEMGCKPNASYRDSDVNSGLTSHPPGDDQPLETVSDDMADEYLWDPDY